MIPFGDSGAVQFNRTSVLLIGYAEEDTADGADSAVTTIDSSLNALLARVLNAETEILYAVAGLNPIIVTYGSAAEVLMICTSSLSIVGCNLNW